MNMDAVDKGLATPLFYACAAGNLEAVSFLCDYGVQVNHKDRYELSALVMAVRENHFEVADRLLMHNSTDINLKVTTRGGTVLHYVCDKEFGDTTTVEYLLNKKDLSVLRTDRNGDTCLAYATSRPDKLRLICTHCKQKGTFRKLVKSRNGKGHNIFHSWAILDNSVPQALEVITSEILSESYTLLMELYNEPDKKNLMTPLHWLIRRRVQKQVDEHLEQYRKQEQFSNPWLTNQSGDTALHMAVRNNDHRAVEQLIMIDKAGRSFSILDASCLTPETLSLEEHRPRITQHLMNAKQVVLNTSVTDKVDKEIKKHPFIVLLLSSFCLPASIEDSVDRVYRAKGCVLGISSLEPDQVNQMHWSYRAIADPTKRIASRYNMIDSQGNRVSSFIRNIISSSPVKQRGSLTAPLDPLLTSRLRSPTTMGSPTEQRTLNFANSKQKMRNRSFSNLPDIKLSLPTNALVSPSAAPQKIGMVVLDAKGTVLFTCRSTSSSDIQTSMDIFSFCMSRRMEDQNMLEHRDGDDAAEWAMRDERIVMLFVSAIAEEWNGSFTIDFQKLIRSATDLNKRSLLKRKFDIHGEFEDKRTLELYKNYLRCKNGVVTCNDVRKDAFYCFVKNEEKHTTVL
ncbi:hypothetical protein AKO1_009873 [Acrasis kona]|uniref:Uncharacterized protein n=1 Tax=Acrasis kona TaxID=1008807 RepID=A0AAW2ZNF3_9EUKA